MRDEGVSLPHSYTQRHFSLPERGDSLPPFPLCVIQSTEKMILKEV